jgi:Receptor family ligand binding region
MYGMLEVFLINFPRSFVLKHSAAADDLIKDRQRSPTWLTTTGYPPSYDVYCSILAFFNWTKVYICHNQDDPTEYFGYIASQVKSHLATCGVQFTQTVSSSSDKSISVKAILREFNMKSRGKW